VNVPRVTNGYSLSLFMLVGGNGEPWTNEHRRRTWNFDEKRVAMRGDSELAVRCSKFGRRPFADKSSQATSKFSSSLRDGLTIRPNLSEIERFRPACIRIVTPIVEANPGVGAHSASSSRSDALPRQPLSRDYTYIIRARHSFRPTKRAPVIAAKGTRVTPNA